MKLIDLSSDEQRTRSVYKVLAIIAGIVILGTGSYGVVATTQLGVEVVGETLVTVEFPPIEGFPLYKPKPVTWPPPKGPDPFSVPLRQPKPRNRGLTGESDPTIS